jgi:methylated-DNA-[protein]-cysteine S-methyltransferase
MKATHPIVAQARIDTPLGPMRLAATAQGLAGLWFDGQAHHPGTLDAPEDARQTHIAQALRELQAYWRGERQVFEVALDADGTPFQRAVWAQLRLIGAGELSTYGALAANIGRPAAVRAVGAAVGRNPVSIIVPCHRVIGRDGTLTGYAGGLGRKQALLELERAPKTTKAVVGPPRGLESSGRATLTQGALVPNA